MEIRQAKTTDVIQIAGLLKQCFNASMIKCFITALFNNFILAESNKKIIAVIGLRRNLLHALSVLPQHRGKGTASALVEAAEMFLRAKRYSFCYGHSKADNLEKYIKRGYSIEGLVRLVKRLE